jgi:hypothetical protein
MFCGSLFPYNHEFIRLSSILFFTQLLYTNLKFEIERDIVLIIKVVLGHAVRI